MKYLNLKAFAAFALGALVFSSCKKVDEAVSIGTAGQTIVKLIGNQGILGDPGFTDVQQNNIDLKLVTTPSTYDAVDVRRDVPNSKSMNTTMTVKVKADPGLVTLYNSNYGSTYVSLPDSLVSVGTNTPLVGNVYTVTLNPGELAKQIQFTISDGTKLDLNKSYAMGFSIVSADGDGKVTINERKVVVVFGVRNQWDGKYTDTWKNYHPTGNPGYTGDVTNVEMRTTGSNKVKIYFNGAAAFGNPAIISGALSYYGAQEPEYTINTATNAVTVQNAAAGAVTFYTMASGFNSRYDPATKTFYVKFGYSYAIPGVFDVGCREWTQTITYVGPR